MKRALIVLLFSCAANAQQPAQQPVPNTNQSEAVPRPTLEESYAKLRFEYIRAKVDAAEAAFDAQLKAKYHAEDFDYKEVGLGDFAFVPRPKQQQPQPRPQVKPNSQPEVPQTPKK